MSPLPLEIDHLTKFYGNDCAVNGISFSIEPGQIFGLLGPNGAGKTSTISVINTLETPSSGSVKVFGHDVTKETRKVKQLLGCVPQELINHVFFNVEDILRNHSGYYGIYHNREHINMLLERLDLNPHRKKSIKQLSGGMKRRVLIAKAMLHKPSLVLLDEPTAGVDLELRVKLWDFVKEMRDEGVTFLITTHYIEEAESLCDRIAILNRGKIAAIDTTKHLIKSHSKRTLTIELKKSIKCFLHPNLISQKENILSFEIAATEALAPLLESLPFELQDICNLNIKEGSLEQALIKILGENHVF